MKTRKGKDEAEERRLERGAVQGEVLVLEYAVREQARRLREAADGLDRLSTRLLVLKDRVGKLGEEKEQKETKGTKR